MVASALEQIYRERPPVPALAGRVACVWVQSVSPRSVPYVHRTVPNGSVEISCRLGSVPQVSGPQFGATVDVLAPGTTVVGIRFRPGAAPVPASALAGRSVELQELWGSAAIALGERIAEAPTAWDAAAILEAELIARVGDAARPDPIVAEAVRRLVPWGANEVTSLTSSLSISERQLRRRCREAIGLAPKAVHRILRFQGFLALAHGREPSGPRAGAARRGRGLCRPVPPDARVFAAVRAHASRAPARERAPVRTDARSPRLVRAPAARARASPELVAARPGMAGLFKRSAAPAPYRRCR